MGIQKVFNSEAFNPDGTNVWVSLYSNHFLFLSNRSGYVASCCATDFLLS